MLLARMSLVITALMQLTLTGVRLEAGKFAQWLETQEPLLRQHLTLVKIQEHRQLQSEPGTR